MIHKKVAFGRLFRTDLFYLEKMSWNVIYCCQKKDENFIPEAE